MSITNDGALEALRALLASAESGVNFRASLNHLLDENPVLFCLEVKGSPAVGARNLVATMKPTKRFQAFVSTVAAEDEPNALGRGRVGNIDRDHAFGS